MTKITRRGRHHSPRRRKPKVIDNTPSLMAVVLKTIRQKFVFIAIFILATIPFAFGKYFEFNQPDPFDSGAYVYSAKHLLDGAKLGIDEMPSARMGTLLVNIIGVSLFGFNETGPEIIQAILQAFALIFMFVALMRLFGVLPAAVGSIMASLYLSAPIIAKYGNVKEQYMIAFMILGMCSFVIYQLAGKWWFALAAGMYLGLAPLFKETGFSAIGAVGIFVIAQPILKHNSWKKLGSDILLLFAGAAISIGLVFLWVAAQKAPARYYPYSSVFRMLSAASDSTNVDIESSDSEPGEDDAQAVVQQNRDINQSLFLKIMPSYVRDSWQVLTPEQIKDAKQRVFRWYRVMILPIVLALGSVITRLVRLYTRRGQTFEGYDSANVAGKFVLLFAVWWLLDMSFVWISPRSYEQYYLPLNASAAMLSGYILSVYCEKVKAGSHRVAWISAGAIGFIIMIIMSQHIVFGVKKIPFSGVKSSVGQNGYMQRYEDIKARVKRGSRGYWEYIGEYIRKNSTSDDGIYVWGWYPGIYVSAQRMSPAPRAFESGLHTSTPAALSGRVGQILNAFKKNPPKFIVDSRKRHFPWTRPTLELWPCLSNGYRLFAGLSDAENKRLWSVFLDIFKPDDMNKASFLRADVPSLIVRYEDEYAKTLAKQIEPDEALRFKALEPLRRYIMENYTIVESDQYRVSSDGRLYHRTFGEHVLFQRKESQ